MRFIWFVTAAFVVLFSLSFWSSFPEYLPWRMSEQQLVKPSSLASVYGYLFSALGFLTSLYAAYAVNSLQKTTYAKVRLPAIRKNLTDLASTISGYTGTTNRSDCAPVLAKIESTLKALATHEPSSIARDRKKAQALLKEVRKQVSVLGVYDSRGNSHWSLYEQLSLLANSLGEHFEDERLRI